MSEKFEGGIPSQEKKEGPRQLTPEEAQKVVDNFLKDQPQWQSKNIHIEVWGHENHSGITVSDKDNPGTALQLSTDNYPEIGAFWRQDLPEDEE
mgnify:CR=1 FL=1